MVGRLIELGIKSISEKVEVKYLKSESEHTVDHIVGPPKESGIESETEKSVSEN